MMAPHAGSSAWPGHAQGRSSVVVVGASVMDTLCSVARTVSREPSMPTVIEKPCGVSVRSLTLTGGRPVPVPAPIRCQQRQEADLLATSAVAR